jgi:hypothetical protein
MVDIGSVRSFCTLCKQVRCNKLLVYSVCSMSKISFCGSFETTSVRIIDMCWMVGDLFLITSRLQAM